MRPGKRGARWALAGVLALCGACVPLQRGGLYPPGADAVFLEYFDNETFFRDFQFDLTERIRDEILSRPGLRLSSKEAAEIVLGGRIVDIQQRVLSEDPQRVTTSQSTTITVVVDVTDARSGELLRRERLARTGWFVPAFDETLDDGRSEAFHFLARDIVRLLEAPF